MPSTLSRYLWRTLLVAVSLSAALPSHARTAVPVAVIAVKKQAVYREVEVTGSVTSPRVARLSTATDGLIVEMLAEEGDRVETGSKLLSLDSELARQQLAAADAQVKQAEIALADARRRLKEAEALGPRGGIAETLIENTRTEVAEDEAALARFRADAARQKAILQRHTLTAPFAGIISHRLAEVGEWVSTGDGVFELVATEGLRLDFSLAEDFLTQVSTDTNIEFRLNAIPGKQFQGRVKAIVPVAEPGARTFLLRVYPNDTVPGMMPGLSVIATLRNPADSNTLAVPEDAILRHPDGRVVVWVAAQGDNGPVAEERPVITGTAFAGMVAILSGLADGDRVIVQGNEALQEAQPLRIIPAGGEL